MKQATFKTRDGETVTVKVGDWVGFKSDYEQSGKITKIRGSYGVYRLTLENRNGFGGEYLRYATTTEVLGDDIWVDG